MRPLTESGYKTSNRLSDIIFIWTPKTSEMEKKLPISCQSESQPKAIARFGKNFSESLNIMKLSDINLLLSTDFHHSSVYLELNVCHCTLYAKSLAGLYIYTWAFY